MKKVYLYKFSGYTSVKFPAATGEKKTLSHMHAVQAYRFTMNFIM